MKKLLFLLFFVTNIAFGQAYSLQSNKIYVYDTNSGLSEVLYRYTIFTVDNGVMYLSSGAIYDLTYSKIINNQVIFSGRLRNGEIKNAQIRFYFINNICVKIKIITGGLVVSYTYEK